MLRTNFDVAFDITRASHVVLTVSDLERSRAFYTEVCGLAVSADENRALYLRGTSETAHHSVVLYESRDSPACVALGFRVFKDENLDPLRRFLDRQGLSTSETQRPYQSRTLQATDRLGVRYEFCATMAREPRLIDRYDLHRGGRARYLAHHQIRTPEVLATTTLWTEGGFRISEWIDLGEEGFHPRAVFLQRKGDPIDLAVFDGPTPGYHHVAFVSDRTSMLHACDVAQALGFPRLVEYGPGRHGPSYGLFLYLRDPDGHRIELFDTNYPMIDSEEEALRWGPNDLNLTWHPEQPASWSSQVSQFADTGSLPT